MTIFFGEIKDLVVVITCDVVDGDIGVFQDIFDDTFVIFIETATFGIKDKFFVRDREETFIIGVFFFDLFGSAASGGFCLLSNFFEFFSGALEFFIIDVFFRVDKDIEEILLENSKEVRSGPVEGDTGLNKEAKIEGETDGEDEHTDFVEF